MNARAHKSYQIYAPGSTFDNPTHSDIAKDHFDDMLNEPAGKVAQVVVRECVTRVVEAWSTDDEGVWNRKIDEVRSLSQFRSAV